MPVVLLVSFCRNNRERIKIQCNRCHFSAIDHSLSVFIVVYYVYIGCKSNQCIDYNVLRSAS